MIPAYITPNDFFSLLNKASSLNATGVTEFLHPLLLYDGDVGLRLYKTVSGVTYATIIKADEDGNITVNFGTVQEEIDNNSLEGIEIYNFKLRLLREFGAIELTKPYDMDLLLSTHEHDMHKHAGYEFDDILM